jgi:glutamate transport system substrate-binding protein
MRITRLRLLAVGAVAALALSACGGGGGESLVEVNENPQFDAGSTMKTLADAGTIKVGVKYDQPGVGYKDPAEDSPSGFDIEMGKIVAARLGIAPDKIEWVETISKNREPFLKNGTVDIVVASYSITDDRRKEVGQFGPYYVTGQQLLVRKDDSSINSGEDLSGKKVCSVTGSTSLKSVEEKYGAQPVPFSTYSECVTQLKNSSVDAVTTDGAILLGYAAQDPDNLKVVGEPFTEERYGIGYKHGDTAMCNFLAETYKTIVDDGVWKTAFDQTLGEAGVEAPTPPTPDACS